jgi:prevent-host-death family protein
MRAVNVDTAKTTFSKLLDRVEHGQEITITRNGRPVAKLVPASTRRSPRPLGRLKGKIRIAADFDAPLPEELLSEFENPT